MNVSTVTAAAVNPETFHLDCVDHLCQLENHVSVVRSEAGQGPSTTKLDALLDIMANVSEFAECRFSGSAFKQLADRIHTIYRRSKAIEALLQDASWTSVKRLFGQRSAENANAELLRAYEQLNKDFNLFLVEYFVACVKRFDTTSNEKKVFLDSVDTFIHEVERIWN